MSDYREHYTAIKEGKLYLIRLEPDLASESPLSWSDPAKADRPFIVDRPYGGRPNFFSADTLDQAWEAVQKMPGWQESWKNTSLESGEDNQDYLDCSSFDDLVAAVQRLRLPCWMITGGGHSQSSPLRLGGEPYLQYRGMTGIAFWLVPEALGDEEVEKLTQAYLDDFTTWREGDVWQLIVTIADEQVLSVIREGKTVEEVPQPHLDSVDFDFALRYGQDVDCIGGLYTLEGVWEYLSQELGIEKENCIQQ